LTAEAKQSPAAWILSENPEVHESGPRVWGLSAYERARRVLLRAGVSRIEVLAVGDAPPGCSTPSVVLRDDFFYDERLLEGLLVAENCVLEVPSSGAFSEEGASEEGAGAAAEEAGAIPVAARVDSERLAAATALLAGRPSEASDALQRVGVLDLAPAYNPALRRHDPPFVYPASEEKRREIEDRIFAASYKGITDGVTKWVFPRPARAMVRVLARSGVRPNSVTAWSYGLTLLVIWLFAEGWFATGLCLGWLMTFLDTVDGKLARCTLTSSRLGGALDHGLDLVHPPIWWAAWAFGLPGGIAGNEVAFWIVVGGYGVGRLLEGAFLAFFGMELFVWRPFDGFFRTIIARRNPNLILLGLGVASGSPTGGFRAVAGWTAICLAVAATTNVQAYLQHRRGIAIRPWFDVVEDRDASK
jgi:hypothetical protein